MEIIYLNGQFKKYQEAFIHIEDRGFQFADGVYEVILFKNNKLIDIDGHINRLFRSISEMQMNIKISKARIIKIAKDLFDKNNLKEGSIYLQISRGTSPRSQTIPKNINPTIFAKISQLSNNNSQIPEPISVITVEDTRWKRCDIKSISLMPGSFAKQKALDLGFQDAIFVKDSMIMEASFANIFMVDNNQNLITRFADNNILSGITRDRIIDLARRNKINIMTRSIPYLEILQAKEIFMTSSTLLIRPISRINDAIINDGKIGDITQKLHDLYQDFINLPIYTHSNSNC
jgi:D-alanine transaminase